ncbi:hypothetical protein HY405_02060 [Candidatus Microgenomates bacterium]|nr:hypothetical protein [Candidatus Microgenomates bacterium]
MKIFFLTGIVLILLVLDWAASDDITTGNEPSFLGEYFIVVFNIPLFLVAGYFLLRKGRL